MIKYKNFIVYPECGKVSIKKLKHESQNNQYVVTSRIENDFNKLVIYYNEKRVYERAKYRIYKDENVLQGIRKPEVIRLGDKKVLVLICYEILFPEDYVKKIKDVDVIIHIVGFPMYDENQMEGWIGMQKILSITFDCPVVCSCGGDETNMNITGIVDKSTIIDEVEEV